MSQNIFLNKLEISQELYELVVNDIIPGIDINAEYFWKSVPSIISAFLTKNEALL